MGFLDKIKETAGKLKEENKNFGSTMKRMNNRNDFYGVINREIKDGDFSQLSYVNIENGKGVIYGSAQDDYVFGVGDVKSFALAGKGADIPMGSVKLPSLRFDVVFADGKKAQADIVCQKVEMFKASLGIS